MIIKPFVNTATSFSVNVRYKLTVAQNSDIVFRWKKKINQFNPPSTIGTFFEVADTNN